MGGLNVTIASQPQSVREEFPDIDTTGQAGDPYPQQAQPTPSSPSFSQQVADELPFLRRIVRRWRTVGADADDLAQDTLMRALAGAEGTAPGSHARRCRRYFALRKVGSTVDCPPKLV